MENYPREFENIENDKDGRHPRSDRLRIPGGWIVRTWNYGEGVHSIFISDPEGKWILDDRGSA